MTQVASEFFAVRSDAWDEDHDDASHAGRYLSLLNIEKIELPEAIIKVLDCMPGDDRDKVMVQSMVESIQFAGVASTHRISDGAPWYCIELAPEDSSAVTSGKTKGRMYAVARHRVDAVLAQAGLDPVIALALRMLLELEEIFGRSAFEVEFALSDQVSSHSLQVHLLQCRPLTMAAQWTSMPDSSDKTELPSLQFLQADDPYPGILGESTILTLMSDWNPAELIGSHPRPLALSLFETLIAHGTWWRARSALGYAPTPEANIALVRPLAGRPWIDVRRSANSLLPAELPPHIGSALVNHWLNELRANPQWHDKVEFKVFCTVRDFHTVDQLAKQWAPCLTTKDLKIWEQCLSKIGRRMLGNENESPMHRYANQVIEIHNMPIGGQPWQEMLSRCHIVAFAFAVLARLDFAAQAQLHSAVVRGALNEDRAMAIKVAGRSTPILSNLAGPQDDLWALHGRMRPGSFDITQSTWSEQNWSEFPSNETAFSHFTLTSQESRAINSLLTEAGYSMEASHWLQFLQQTSQWREWGKFVLGRQLSGVLDGIASTLAEFGIGRDEGSWLTLEEINSGLRLNGPQRTHLWTAQAGMASRKYANEARIIVSPILYKENDRFFADSQGLLPNFIGQKAVEGSVTVLDSFSPWPETSLSHSIVVIDRADPGFDWLFQYQIAGLITAWGGANSHMAIRCAEFGLSAAIGCGEAVLRQAARARRARIDPVAGDLWLN